MRVCRRDLKRGQKPLKRNDVLGGNQHQDTWVANLHIRVPSPPGKHTLNKIRF